MSLATSTWRKHGHPPIQAQLQHREQLYPPPHNALFDFSKNAEQSRWVDEIAAKARHTILEYEELDHRTASHGRSQPNVNCTLRSQRSWGVSGCKHPAADSQAT